MKRPTHIHRRLIAHLFFRSGKKAVVDFCETNQRCGSFEPFNFFHYTPCPIVGGAFEKQPTMKFKKDGLWYEVAYFFGRAGEPKDKMDPTTPCVRAKTHEAFNVVECEWPEGNQYASIFEALCKIPANKDKMPSEIAMIARELSDSGCIVDHEGDIILPDGDVYWPNGDRRTGSIGFTGEEPNIW